MALRENMDYDSEKDEYTCQGGQKIRAKYVGERKSRSGFIRAFLKSIKTPNKFVFCPHTSLIFLEIHKGFLRQIALSGDNIRHFCAFHYFSEKP